MDFSEPPLLTEIGIIGRNASYAVLFNVFDIWVRFQAPNRVIELDLIWNPNMYEIRVRMEGSTREDRGVPIECIFLLIQIGLYSPLDLADYIPDDPLVSNQITDLAFF